jgi:DNA polymerase I-like protein with 3'-5' exonuclease and polymerase domains
MLVFDCETDGFLEVMTVIHCLHITDRSTGRKMRFSGGVYSDGSPARRDGSVEDGVRLLMEAEVICGHNIFGFDNAAIRKIYPWFAPEGREIDTLVWSRLIWTNLKDIDAKAIKARIRPPEFTGKMVGAHSLEAWGFRLGVFKGDYSAVKRAEAEALGLETDEEIGRYTWEKFTREMDDYCEQDVAGTIALLEKIESKGYSEEALQLELDVAKIIALQEAHGFLFDSDKAMRMVAELSARRAELEDQLREVIKPWYAPSVYKGEHEVLTPKTNNRTLGRTKDCPLTKVEVIVFNPGSRHHIADRMKTLFGWVPTEFTDSGQPKVDETTLASLPYPEAKLIVTYLTVQKRLGQIAEGDNAWLKKVGPDGRIHGRVNPNGARTGRMTHFSPNMAQVPSVKLDTKDNILFGEAGGWGYESRDCFKVRPGYKLVGCDAEGLELRMLAHYMARFDGGAYVKTVTEGTKSDGSDVHSVNTRAAGLRLRANGKTFIYSYLYGAGNPKIGETVYEDMTPEQQAAFNVRVAGAETKARAAGQDATEVRIKMLGGLGLRARKRIEEGLPALGKLQDLVKEKAKRGFIKGLDGRLLFNHSAHAALNTTLQGAGAIVMKVALVIAHKAYLAKGWTHGNEFAFVANVHDEAQMEVREDLAEEAGRIFADAIRLAGEHFNLNCPTAGAYQVGDSWAASH